MHDAMYALLSICLFVCDVPYGTCVRVNAHTVPTIIGFSESVQSESGSKENSCGIIDDEKKTLSSKGFPR